MARLPKGTLIVFVHTVNDWLVCADKRTTYDATNFHDESTKLFELGPSAVFAIGGVPFASGRGTAYNAAEAVISGFRRHGFDVGSSAAWTEAQAAVARSFSSYLRSLAPNELPPPMFPDANFAFTQVLFFFPMDGRVSIKLMQLQYRSAQPVDAQVRLFDVKPNGIYDALGSTGLERELKRGNDPRFQDLRDEPRLRPFLRDEVQPEQVTVESALTFAKSLILLSGTRGALLRKPGEDIGIGATCDAVLVTPAKGIVWIARGAPVAAPPEQWEPHEEDEASQQP